MAKRVREQLRDTPVVSGLAILFVLLVLVALVGSMPIAMSAAVALGTGALAFTTMQALHDEVSRNKARRVPLVTFDFLDLEKPKTMAGFPGLRFTTRGVSDGTQKLVALEGVLRNLSETPVVECRLSVARRSGASGLPSFPVQSGLGAKEHLEKRIEVADIAVAHPDAIAHLIFTDPDHADGFPHVVFSYKNIDMSWFCSVYGVQAQGHERYMELLGHGPGTYEEGNWRRLREG